ncbi:DcuS/MalK family sensor histidine kinase [Planococcus salinus]|uniref:histidine kinase n=1 Tax=Planococcus salinus TaxID=1848460 RepID=A0A3M8P5N6_9BACL|nr:DcuS/MalK family sensor histidine kinase [Planococcus salinus]RNF38987.1 two-component system sensor histidine kinase DcuS [Planococcus salinus]
MNPSRFKLSTMIIFFVCLVVLTSLVITSLLVTESVSETIEKQLEGKAVNVSRIVAESQVARDGLQDEAMEQAIQNYAMAIQDATEVLFVVVMDMEGIRKSHPNPEQLGGPFVGGDEKRALQGQEYTSRSTGTLGRSVRSFTPILNDQQVQIGAVAVGISLQDVEASIQQSRKQILVGSIIGLLVGVLGAFWLARYIKKSLFGLEPYAIARIHEERNQMLHSVYEGVIAIDRDSRIVLVNKSARQIFQKAGLLSKDPVGMHINDFLPVPMMDSVLGDRQAVLDEEQNLNGVSIISNRVPLVVNGQVIGAIATFRDKTEVNQLAEQLTGVKMYADTLRAQSHEFMNQLHVLLGMIKMREFDQVQDFIAKLVNHQAYEVGNVIRHIKDPVFAGFIIGKISYAREARVNLIVSCETEIPKPANSSVTHELITILGNVIDNAIDNVMDKEQRRIVVEFSYIDELLTMTVEDTGSGIPEELQHVIFEKGISSKEGEHRGFGLHLTKGSVEKLGGSIEIESEMEKGTAFTIIIPFEAGGENDD